MTLHNFLYNIQYLQPEILQAIELFPKLDDQTKYALFMGQESVYVASDKKHASDIKICKHRHHELYSRIKHNEISEKEIIHIYKESV